MMPRSLAALALVPALMLGGCAFNSLDHGLSGLVGQDVDQAVAQLGAPNAERKLGDVRELEWNTFSNRTVALGSHGENGFRMPRTVYLAPPATSALLSMRTPAGASPSLNQVSTRPQYCKVVVQVDSRDVIRDYRYDGNFEGCYTCGQLLVKNS